MDNYVVEKYLGYNQFIIIFNHSENGGIYGAFGGISGYGILKAWLEMCIWKENFLKKIM